MMLASIIDSSFYVVMIISQIIGPGPDITSGDGIGSLWIGAEHINDAGHPSLSIHPMGFVTLFTSHRMLLIIHVWPASFLVGLVRSWLSGLS
jgi:hypothetical protein